MISHSLLVSYHAFGSSPMIDVVFQAMQAPDLFDMCVDAVVALLHATSNFSIHFDVVQKVRSRVVCPLVVQKPTERGVGVGGCSVPELSSVWNR